MHNRIVSLYFAVFCAAVCLISSTAGQQTTPSPTPGALCNKYVCCPAFCGRRCGATSCNSRPRLDRNCCQNEILRSGRMCGSRDPPCIRETPVGLPEQIPPPSGVRNAVCTRDYCCDASCGLCDGEGCDSRIGGASNCCGSSILHSGRLCSVRAPPCIRRIPPILPKLVDPPPGITNAVCTREFCCKKSCGLCDGVDCHLRPGGHSSCCGTSILLSGRLCRIKGPPCIRRIPPELPIPVRPPRGIKNAVCTNAFCCKATCGLCDGINCHLRPGGHRNCCGTSILHSGRVCGRRRAPCIREIPPGIPEQVPPPRGIAKAVCTRSFCCKTSCGLCDGVDCQYRPGGSNDCCGTSILSSGRVCGTKAAPCIREIPAGIPEQVSPPRGITKAVCTRAFCCKAGCGLCDGLGCELRPGGEQNCCGFRILEAGRSCRRMQLPCIRANSGNVPPTPMPGSSSTVDIDVDVDVNVTVSASGNSR